ncbi:hypothetical protein AHAS_Ahas10G0156900 [Arachis hypogaea]
MWRVVVNTKPRGRIETNHVHVEEDEEENDVAYQVDESNPSRIFDTEPPISLKSPYREDRIVELSIGSSSRANKIEYDDVMAPQVKGKAVKGHRGYRTTTAAAISTTSTSSGTFVALDFQSGPLSQQPYLMLPNLRYMGLPPSSWPTPGCMGPSTPPLLQF